MTVEGKDLSGTKLPSVGPPDLGSGAPDLGSGAEEQMEANERIVRESFWHKLRKRLGQVPFAQDLLAAYYCTLDPHVPVKVRATLLAALAYFVAPVDVLPDVLVGIGFTDDAGVLVMALKMVSDHITPEHKAKARAALAQEDPNPPPP